MDETLNILAYGGIAVLVILLIIFEIKEGRIGRGAILRRTEDMNTIQKAVRHSEYVTSLALCIRHMCSVTAR